MIHLKDQNKSFADEVYMHSLKKLKTQNDECEEKGYKG